MLKRILRKLTVGERAELEWYRKSRGPFGPGHFYSPIPDLEMIKHEEEAIWGQVPDAIEGVDLNVAGQLELFSSLCKYYGEMHFTEQKISSNRYYFENNAYSYSDAILLHCMIRLINPQRIIEVGSGHSSCVILDTSELFYNGRIDITFIEPYPQLLISLTKEGDLDKQNLIKSRLQDVPLTEFDRLESGDILFVDSTHVSKINSDVNYLFFKILPALKSGVWIHIHDIFYPFEYPKHWVYEGRAWNENYLLRAFLQYNRDFSIELFSTYLHLFHQQLFHQHMPLCLRNDGGCIWLKKR